MDMNPGILIAVEGVDGAGKTTQVDRLTDFLRAAGEDAIRSKEPTTGRWGRLIRESASSGRMSLDDELAAFIADRDEHVRTVIQPSLNHGQIVLLDRYFYSTIAYQGARGKDIDELTTLVLEKAPEPDAVILLDVPAELGVSRVQGRGDRPNQFEELASLKTVRGIFLQLAQQRRNIIVIDGTADTLTVQKAILTALLNGVLKSRSTCARMVALAAAI